MIPYLNYLEKKQYNFSIFSCCPCKFPNEFMVPRIMVHHPLPSHHEVSPWRHLDSEDLRQKATRTQYYQDQLKGFTWPADWSNRVHSASRLGEVRAKEVCFNHHDRVLYGPIRSIPNPHGWGLLGNIKEGEYDSSIGKPHTVSSYLLSERRCLLWTWTGSFIIFPYPCGGPQDPILHHHCKRVASFSLPSTTRKNMLWAYS